MLEYKLLKIKQVKDQRGDLSVIQNSDLPFKIERIFWAGATSLLIKRGDHVHPEEPIQALFCARGSCDIELNNGYEKVEVSLRGDNILIVKPMIWHKMYNYSDDCLLFTLASTEYNEADYIRDRKKFDNIPKYIQGKLF
ncbi:MAG: FdtA/QdtA family cupin domain-containing protein [Candidatus Woesearchaeota archaeon]